MRVPTRARQFGLTFDLTPMIDIVFLLIIFFLVANHFVTTEVQDEVDLSRTEYQDKKQQQTPRRLVVTILKDHTLRVGGQTKSLPDIESMLIAAGEEKSRTGQDYEIRIRMDRKTPYRILEPILLACAESGLTNINHAVLQR